MTTCLECGSTEPKLVTGERIYPHRPDLHAFQFYLCACGAYCGVHKGTTVPIGNPAGPETRAARMRGHEAFDPLWMDGDLTRAEAYDWLAKEMQLDPADCHVGLMTREQADRVVELCNARRGPPAWIRDLMEPGS